MDHAYQNAILKRNQLLERKKALLAEQLEVDHEINFIDRFLKMYRAFAEEEVAPGDHDFVIAAEDEGNKEGSYDTNRIERPRNSRKEEVAAAARQVIAETSAPVPRANLLEALRARGLTIEGKDPEAVLSTMLWRMRDQITRRKDGRYSTPEIDALELFE